MRIDNIDNSKIKDTDQWYVSGVDYEFAFSGAEDYALARACYEQALKLNPKYIN